MTCPRFFHSGLRSASLRGPCRRPRGECWGPGRGGPDPAAEPQRDATTFCRHLRTSPKSLKSDGGEESRQRWKAKHAQLQLQLAQAAPRMRRGAGVVHRAHRRAHPASHDRVNPVLPAFAPVGAAPLQPQLSGAASTSSAPSTCPPPCLRGHLRAGTRSPRQQTDGHPGCQGVHPPQPRLHTSPSPDAGAMKHHQYAASPRTDANSAAFQS